MLAVKSPLKNCMSCALYLKCKDPLKSVIYQCNSYTAGSGDGMAAMKRLFDAIETPMPDVLARPRDYGPSISSPKSLDNFDIYSLVDQALSAKSLVSPDIKISEGDFPLAPNFLEFCLSDKFLKVKPYIAQALIGIKLFGEYCPHCSDNEYFDNYGVGDKMSKLRRKICLLEHGKCPSCKRTQHYFHRKGLLNLYEEVAISAGQRSGKSAVVSMLAAYHTHRTLKLQNPNEVYELMKSNVLHGTFVALTFAQAKDTLWDPFLGNILESPWFLGYHGMLDDYEHRTGETLYKLNDTFLTYNHRRMTVYPAGPDKRNLRGRTRFMAGVDEIGWFDNTADSTKVKLSASEVYIALERSLLTVRVSAEKLWAQGFTHVPPAMFLNVSSPSSVRDKIMELVRKSQGSRKILGLIRPTWEMNPKVTFKDLASEFKADPTTAQRDYGAEPPLSSNAFLSQSLVAGVVGDKPNVIALNHETKRNKKTQESMRYATITKVGRTGKPSCLALDAGYVNNSFAIAVGHLIAPKMPQIDIVAEIMPLPGARLNFSRIYKHVLVPLLEARNVKLVCADRWNSIKILSDIEEEHDIETRQYSLRYADMRLFKDYMEDKKILMPNPKREMEEITGYDQSNYPACFRNDPIGHFYLQLLTVQDTGSSVIKGDQLTDDMVRAAMLCTRMLLEEDYAELWEGERIEQVKNVDVQSIAVQRGYSGGGGGGAAVSKGGAALGVRKTRL